MATRLHIVKTTCEKYLLMEDIIEVSEKPFIDSEDALAELLKDNFIIFIRTKREDYYTTSLKESNFQHYLRTFTPAAGLSKDALYVHFIKQFIGSREKE